MNDKEHNPNEKSDPIQDKAESERKKAGKAFKNLQKEPGEFMNKLVTSETRRFVAPKESKEDLLKAQAVKMRQKSNPIVESAGPQQMESFILEGHKLPLSRIPAMDAMSTMMYIFSTVLSKDKRIEKILKQANFEFKDLDGNQIFPKVKKKRKVKIHAKRRKHKPKK